MGLDDFLDEFSNDDLRELGLAIGRNEVSADREQRLRELLESTSMEERQAIFDEKPAIIDVLDRLGIDFEFPNGEAGFLGEEEDAAEEFAEENGVEIEEVDRPTEPRRESRRRAGPDLPGTERPTGLEPGEEVVQDNSRLSGDPIRRDIGFEQLFMDLIRDVGRCRQFDCTNEELYFRLTDAEKRRYYDMTPAEVLAWLVDRREITPSQLAARGFPSDVIP